jgi:phosphatidylglycerol:prolipoprotein diacylglycerol transferase
VFKIWEGGMSFHGALIGIIFGTNLFAINRKISSFFLLDAISCVAPIGIFFGRLANFINAELVGKVTEVSWSVIFPTIDLLPRHPSQLYEAFLEGLILFLILNIYILKRNYKTGTCSCLFLINYGVFRIISEFYREPDSQVGYLFDQFSMGAILSFLMIVAGAILIVFIKKNEK